MRRLISRRAVILLLLSALLLSSHPLNAVGAGARNVKIETAARDHILLPVDRFDLNAALVDDPSHLVTGGARPAFLLLVWSDTHFTFSLMKATISPVRLPVGNTPR